mgnify:CR=1 FL=1|tara:strand:- start:2898 stop:3134 length:237 start_codon:yes stop_codon:yes gene_type:complete
MSPKYKIGNIVKVFEYYNDMIVKDAYHGLIVDVACYKLPMESSMKPIYIYHVLPSDVTPSRLGVQTAEEFAIEPIGVI